MKQSSFSRWVGLTLALVFCVTACTTQPRQNQTEESGNSPDIVADNVANVAAQTEYFDETDLTSDWQQADNTTIHCDGQTAEISGSGAAAKAGAITISAAGTYVFTGSFEGQIIVAAGQNDVVRLVFNGFSVRYGGSAALWSQQAKKTVITLADGSQNTIVDGAELAADHVFGDEEANGALYAQDDLTINGEGSLTVDAARGHGIISKDNLRLVSGSLTVTAAKDALRGRDSIVALAGEYTLHAGSDGLQSNNTDVDKGNVTLLGGSFIIVAANDGVQAENNLTVLSGNYYIVAGDEGETLETESYKGFKAAGNLTMEGGTFDIVSADDAIHANGNITISGGELTLSTGDDGIHADGDLTITGGAIVITKSYEGLEGNNVYITGGDIAITAEDDAINAAGGADGSSGGRFGGDEFQGGAHVIDISGGTIYAVGGNDGVDSNGSIAISGGRTEVYINSTPDNTAIDSDGGLTITGGIVIYGGTATGATSTDTQSYLALSNLAGGEEVTVLAGETELLRFTPALDCASLLVSMPELNSGESYQAVIGGNAQALEAGTGASSGMMGGFGGGRPNMEQMPDGDFTGRTRPDEAMPDGEPPDWENGEMPNWGSAEGEMPEGMPQGGPRGGGERGARPDEPQILEEEPAE